MQWDTLNLPFARPQHAFRDANQELVFQLIGPPQTTSTWENGEHELIVMWFGTTLNGSLVRVRSYGKLPNMCSKAPEWVQQLTGEALEKALNSLRETLNNMLAAVDTNRRPVFIESIRVEYQKPLFYYVEQPVPMLFYELNAPKGVKILRDEIYEERALDQYNKVLPKLVYNADIDFTWRCMIDQRLTMCNYVLLKPNTYQVLESVDGRAIEDTNTLEVECQLNKMIGLPCDGPYEQHTPMRLVGLDIECEGRKGIFPEADKDRVLCIGCSVHTLGVAEKLGSDAFSKARNEYFAARPGKKKLSNKRKRKLQKISNDAAFTEGCYVAFHLWDVDPNLLPADKPAVTFGFNDEKEMLLAYASFQRWLRPELVITWNGHIFDIPYLIDRAKTLGCDREFCDSGVRNLQWRMHRATFKNKAFGTRDGYDISYPGVTYLDSMQMDMRGMVKRRSYSLDAVAKSVLGVGKLPIHHSEITPKYVYGGAQGRAEILAYCLIDQERTFQIAYSTQQVGENLELARITGCSIDTLLTRGISAKSYLYIARKCAQRGYVIDYYRRDEDEDDDQGVGYSGALVIEPKVGLYKLIITLDFASLYPSIMQAFNLCYASQLRPEDVDKYDPAKVQYTPADAYFVTKAIAEGLLPEIERELVAARSATKRKMAEHEANDNYAGANNMNNRQLGQKQVGNGVYGFTGARFKLPNLKVSESVTLIGQQLIQLARDEAIRMLRTGENPFGTFPDADVIYGDTDSIMVYLGAAFTDKDLAFQIGKFLADTISALLPKPVKLEFEKVYENYLLLKKKRYAGIKHMEPDKPGELDIKGMDSKRRDNSVWHAKTIETVVDITLKQGSVDAAVEYCKKEVEKLYAHEISLDDLTITVQYSKSADQYKATGNSTKSGQAKAKPAHLVVNAEIIKREGDGAAFHMGDRVPFVIVPGQPGSKKSERARYVEYVKQDNAYVDIQWYLETLGKGLDRIFGLLKGPKFVQQHILTGSHTRKRKSTVTRDVVKRFFGGKDDDDDRDLLTM